MTAIEAMLNLDGKILHLRNPCRKCIVKPICRKHKNCEKYQNWYLRKWFCKHDYKISPLFMRLPTSLSHECTKCGRLI